MQKVHGNYRRKNRVIDLYFINQGKTIREIAKIERMSIRDISPILKKEGSKLQKYKDQEISAQAYQLFSEGKTPIEVAVTLNLPASKVSKMYREYWKLRRLDILSIIHKETKWQTRDIFELYKQLVKKKGKVWTK